MRTYTIIERDPVTYVNKEKFQSLREAVNALLHSEKVELPRTPDEAFEFAERPNGVPDDFTQTKFDKYEAAAFASRKPNRSSSKTGEDVQPVVDPSASVNETAAPNNESAS